MFRSAIAWLAFAVAAPAAASPLIAFEDFESVSPKDTALGTLVTNVGTFTPDPGLNVFVASPGYTNFGPGVNPTTSSILVANGDEGWSLDLAFVAASFQFTVYLNDLGPWEMALYDTSDNLILTFSGDADALDTNNKQTFSYFGNTNRIARASWSSTLGGRLNTGWDDITIAQVETPVVPEPASWALMIAGFGVMGFALRRERHPAARAA